MGVNYQPLIRGCAREGTAAGGRAAAQLRAGTHLAECIWGLPECPYEMRYTAGGVPCFEQGGHDSKKFGSYVN